MFSALINFFLNLVASIIQVVLIPFNTIFINVLPDLTSQINQVTNGISELFTGIGWSTLADTVLAGVNADAKDTT